MVDCVICTSERNVGTAGFDSYVVSQRPASLLRYVLANRRSLSLRSVLVAPILHTRLNVEAAAVIDTLLARHTYDAVFVDFTQAWLLVQRQLRLLDVATSTTLCVHDVFVQRALRTRRWIERALLAAIAGEEQSLFDTVDKLLVLNGKDRDLIRSLYGKQSIDVKKFIPPDWCAKVVRNKQSIDPENVIFFGNFERDENAAAVRWFISEPIDIVRAVIPGFSLTLVGTGSDKLAGDLSHQAVTGTGFQHDPSPFFERCACAIAPLFAGAGVKFKVLEALAAGVPVIGTAVALEGIDTDLRIVQAEPNEFAARLIALLRVGG